MTNEEIDAKILEITRELNAILLQKETPSLVGVRALLFLACSGGISSNQSKEELQDLLSNIFCEMKLVTDIQV